MSKDEAKAKSAQTALRHAAKIIAEFLVEPLHRGPAEMWWEKEGVKFLQRQVKRDPSTELNWFTADRIGIKARFD